MPYPFVTRRELLGGSAAGAASLLLSGTAPVRAAMSGSERSCIFIWLNGGPSQFETFDPKPSAKDDVRGPFGTIQTSVPGVHVSELVPNLAKQFDKYAIVRSLSHR